MDVDASRATAPLLQALNERTVLDVDPRGRADLARRGRAAVGHLQADRLERAAGAASTPAWCARRRRARTGRATAPCSSSRCPTPRSCSASTSAPATCAPRSPTCPAPSARARTSSCTAPTPPACWPRRRGARLAARGRRGSASTWSTRAVVGMPGVVGPGGHDRPRRRRHRPRAARASRQALRDRLAFPVTFENDVNLAAVGEQWGGVAQGVDDFAVLSVGTGTGVGHRARRRAASRPPRRRGRDRPRLRRASALDIDPCAAALRGVRDPVGRNFPGATALRAAVRHAGGVRRRPGRRRAGGAGGRRGGAPDRGCNIVPIAAVADVSLVVLGGGIGANGDLLLTPVRTLLQTWLPYPPDASACRPSASRRCSRAPSPRRCAARSTTSSAAAARPRTTEGAAPQLRDDALR